VFPRFRERLGTTLDLIVEFSTLGEYGLGAEGVSGCVGVQRPAPDRTPQLGGAGDEAARAAVRRTVAGGAAGSPAATPAARRLVGHAHASKACRDQVRRSARERHPTRSQLAGRHRSEAATPGEQLCLAG